MSVIGRLDDQVNRILIEPLAGSDKPAPYAITNPLSPDLPSPDLPPALDAPLPLADRSPGGRRELPVWLL